MTPKPFCKLFETPDLGQIVAMLGTAEDGAPELRFYINEPHSMTGVCSTALTELTECSNSSVSVQTLFEGLTETAARSAVAPLLADLELIDNFDDTDDDTDDDTAEDEE